MVIGLSKIAKMFAFTLSPQTVFDVFAADEILYDVHCSVVYAHLQTGAYYQETCGIHNVSLLSYLSSLYPFFIRYWCESL